MKPPARDAGGGAGGDARAGDEPGGSERPGSTGGARAEPIEIVELEAVPVAMIRSLVAPGDVGDFMADALGMVAAALAEAGTGPAGPSFARYFSMSDEGLDMAAGFPVAEPVIGSGVVRPGELPAGPAAVATHVGPFEGLEAAWASLRQRIENIGRRPGDDPWEVYFIGPGSGAPEAEWRTELVWPLAASTAVA